LVVLRSIPSSSTSAVTGAGVGKLRSTGETTIVVDLNGSWNVGLMRSFAETKGRFQEDLVKHLLHELTHVADVYRKKKDKTTTRVLREDEVDPVEYYNDPAEVRAFMQEIVEDIRKQYPRMRKVFSEREALGYAIKVSDTWEQVWVHLNRKNRQKLLSAVWKTVQEMNEERSRSAGVRDVLNRIIKTMGVNDKARDMARRVMEYFKTKNDKSDLAPDEQRMLYRPVDYGDTLPLTKKRDLDIGWTDHAEYRSDLRDIDHNEANKALAEKMRNKLVPQKGKKPKLRSQGPERMQEPGVGTMVVDYNLEKNPADAQVVTVWASEVRVASNRYKELKKIIGRLPKDVKIHHSSKPISSLQNKSQASDGPKPKGLWYSCGSSWIDWAEEELAYGNYAYLVHIKMGQILHLKTVKDVMDFTKEYGIEPVMTRFTFDIDWKRVASKWSGIEVCPHQFKAKASPKTGWYGGWDVASGCIWSASAMEIEYLGYWDGNEFIDGKGVRITGE